MVEHYIIRNGEIVNCCTADRQLTDAEALRGFEHPEELTVSTNPPLAMLQRYRYWNERP